MALTVKSREAAWAEVNKIFPIDYEKDEAASLRAGYDIYRHPTLNYYSRICDLGNRLEVLTGEYGEDVVNIWIVEEEQPTAEAAALPAYGSLLGDKIRAETTDFGSLPDFEKFVLDRGFYYDTEEALKAAYDRAWKSRHNILITEDDFVAEAGKGGSNTFSQWNEEATRETYKALAALAAAGKITNSEVYAYAVFGWCIRKPEAIVAYQEGRDKWIVNNCAEEITEEAARVAVCEEWGFEASRVRIIGTPYYDATDWQFIRFDCAHMTWLWKNGSLYQVYE